jgi:hypothetical protein
MVHFYNPYLAVMLYPLLASVCRVTEHLPSYNLPRQPGKLSSSCRQALFRACLVPISVR